MTYEKIQIAKADGLATLTLNSPDRLNAVSRKMIAELKTCWEDLAADGSVRAVLLTGAGRGFCAGADLSGGANTFNAENRGPVDPGLDGHRDGGGLFTLRLYDSLKPTIAA